MSNLTAYYLAVFSPSIFLENVLAMTLTMSLTEWQIVELLGSNYIVKWIRNHHYFVAYIISPSLWFNELTSLLKACVIFAHLAGKG